VSSGETAAEDQLLRRARPPDHAGAGPGRPWDEQVPPPGRDATLLAVVPIPGTGTSLAIVGYVIATSAATPAGKSAEPDPALLLDHAQRRAWIDGREIPLTSQEFELLAFLAEHPGTVFTRAELSSGSGTAPSLGTAGRWRGTAAPWTCT
jgi:DNA-binding response OmpR family regulator